ncbi:hypothetical protein CJ030_MR5G017514 [Morella rubra]|uniref:Uncharacterized protein n=1 Tax=Morella rubra TaxID=262757 RepID=A0A6A1VPG1_9ROSI|nr:hypothetical protein CJ030_MR5G017514 [Morella rubra]
MGVPVRRRTKIGVSVRSSVLPKMGVFGRSSVHPKMGVPVRSKGKGKRRYDSCHPDQMVSSILRGSKSPLIINKQQGPSKLPGNGTTKAPDSEWVITMRQEYEKVDDEARSRKNLVISRVPPFLPRGDSKAYAPQIVSLGPYHYRNELLRQMDHHKWRALRHALKREKHDLEDYLRAAKAIEKEARNCYEESFPELEKNEFAKIMLLDGCFVVELLRGATEGYEKLLYLKDDPIFAWGGLLFHCIQRDMVKLENQLPLFVLDKLLGLQLGKPDQRGEVAKLVTRFFDTLRPINEPLTNRDGNQSESPEEPLTNRDGSQSESLDHGGLHILDVFRESLVRTRSNEEGRGFWFTGLAITWGKLVERMPQAIMTFAKCFEGGQQSIRPTAEIVEGEQQSIRPTAEILEEGQQSIRPTAEIVEGGQQSIRTPDDGQQLIHCTTQLSSAGIDFKRRKTACFWDIKFKKGTLEIPQLLIHDGTKSLLLNLIAFELCHPDRGNEITSYVFFMDNLINSEQDVAYLHSCGIIKHWLGSDAEVAKLFNGLCQEVIFDSSHSYLSSLSKDMNLYYGRTWNTWRASFKHKYFSNPWAFISFLAAVVLLLLTLLQTFYGVYGYYKPR